MNMQFINKMAAFESVECTKHATYQRRLNWNGSRSWMSGL